jgi:murein L,D-transpeptidase YcbB/YkuD
MTRYGFRAAAAAGIVLTLGALAGCSSDITTVDQAQAQVKVKQQAVTDADATFATASATFCANAKDYVLALDRYGDILHQTAPTVGDVVDGGADLAKPKADAYDGADAAIDAQAAVLVAEQELADAQTTLARLEAGTSGTPSPVASPDPTLAPLAPPASVERVKAAEKDFADAQAAITPETPLADASELFHSAAVGLQLSWMRLFVDTGCATDEQLAQADQVLSDFTMSVQQDLKDAGYYKGEVDGIYGAKTTQAVEDLQKANDLPITGTLDQATILALQAELVKQGHDEAKDELATTAAVQQTLKLLGYWDGPVDGVWTDELTAAVKDVQKALDVEQTGVIDAATIAAWEKALEEFRNPSASPSPTPSASPSVTPSN